MPLPGTPADLRIAEQMVGQMREAAEARLSHELYMALKRKPGNEAALAGAVLALAPFLPGLLEPCAEVARVLVARGRGRPTRLAAFLVVARSDAARALELAAPLLADEAARVEGALVLIAAASASSSCRRRVAALLEGLPSPRPDVAGSALALARVAAAGRHDGAAAEGFADVATRLRESARVALCERVLTSLRWSAPLPSGACDGLARLRRAERHVGRWLLLAELARRAGDSTVAAEVVERGDAPVWRLVAWALTGQNLPGRRPSADVLARLSDRPSAEKDPTFLFRLAEARAPSATAPMRSLVAGSSPRLALEDPAAIRAAAYLVRNLDDEAMAERLTRTMLRGRREGRRGLAAAALALAGRRRAVDAHLLRLAGSRSLTTACWATLVAVSPRPALDERHFRWLERGWTP